VENLSLSSVCCKYLYYGPSVQPAMKVLVLSNDSTVRSLVVVARETWATWVVTRDATRRNA